jgi:hypothetical protein
MVTSFNRFSKLNINTTQITSGEIVDLQSSAILRWETYRTQYWPP